MKNLLPALLVAGVLVCAVNACSRPGDGTTNLIVSAEPTVTSVLIASLDSIATPTPTILKKSTPPDALPKNMPTISATPTLNPIQVPTPVIDGFLYDAFGFTLRLDSEVAMTSMGWTKTAADAEQGVLIFDHGGSNVFIFWLKGSDITPPSLLADTYLLLQEVEPDLRFASISEGAIEIGNNEGVFGGFALADSKEISVGGGLIGAWVCSESTTAISATVISSNATTLQIRFNRLLQGIEC